MTQAIAAQSKIKVTLGTHLKISEVGSFLGWQFFGQMRLPIRDHELSAIDGMTLPLVPHVIPLAAPGDSFRSLETATETVTVQLVGETGDRHQLLRSLSERRFALAFSSPDRDAVQDFLRCIGEQLGAETEVYLGPDGGDSPQRFAAGDALAQFSF
jgi:hypothetical protein